MFIDYKNPIEIDNGLLIITTEALEDLLASGKSSKALWECFEEYREDIEDLIRKLGALIEANYIGEEPEHDSEDDLENHLGCPAYPNCDIDPNGCSVVMGKNVEWYGHRD